MRLHLCGVLALAALPAFAADKKPMTVDDLWALQRVGAPALSPDGKLVAYPVSNWEADENKLNADLWLLDRTTGASRRLTSNKASDTSPAFSPDGKRIAFVSKRDGDAAAQLYVLPLDGGEPERVTEMPLGVAQPRWLPDGKRIVFVSSVVAGAESPEATKKAVDAREKSKVKARTTESRLYRYWDRFLTDEEYPHLFVLDVASRKTTDLLPGWKRYFSLSEDSPGSFDVSPDGSSIVFSANSTDPPFKDLNQDVYTVPVAGGEARNLTADNPASDDDPIFSPDGKTIAYSLQKKADGWPDRARLALRDVASGKTTVLTEAWDVSVAGYHFAPDGKSLIVRAEVRARTGLYSVPVAGGTPKQLFKGGTALGFEVAPGGEIVFAHSSVMSPPELAEMKADGTGWKALSHVNDERMSALALGEMRELTFKGAGGDDVQMFVVLPPGFVEGKKYPLVHLVHGGPVGTFGDGFSYRWNPLLWAAPGYVTAMVNFHGSSSFGQAWVESILGAHPDKPFTDVMKGTDALIAKGWVDPDRMAAAGGSYGGFLVNWIEGHTDRFKALISHAGVYNLLGQFASDGTWGRHHSYGGYPFTNLANIEKWSPNRYAAAFKTPMLVIHGERDYRVPVTQGLELYGTLQAKGVPSRLVYFPDENHWVLKGLNGKFWYGEVLGWLGKYLK